MHRGRYGGNPRSEGNERLELISWADYEICSE